ncbi:MAG: hypothetical protein RXO76_07595 [Vulcanisaeta sp.]
MIGMQPQTTTNETRKPLRRAVAVELETTKELNKLLYSVETAYLSIVREVVEYAVANNVLSATQLQGLFYRRYRSEYPDLHAHLITGD